MTHYVYGAGLHGCLYQFGPCAAHTLEEAVESLGDCHELGRDRRRQLKRDWYLELNLRRDGNEYCEITECDCATPWEHDEDSRPKDWEVDRSEP